MQKKMQLKNGPPKIRMQKNAKIMQKNCKSIFIAKIKMQKKCKKNANQFAKNMQEICNNFCICPATFPFFLHFTL